MKPILIALAATALLGVAACALSGQKQVEQGELQHFTPSTVRVIDTGGSPSARSQLRLTATRIAASSASRLSMPIFAWTLSTWIHEGGGRRPVSSRTVFSKVDRNSAGLGGIRDLSATIGACQRCDGSHITPGATMKILLSIAVLGLVLGACSFKSETVVQKPVPASTSTTYVQPDSSSPSGVSATTVYRN